MTINQTALGDIQNAIKLDEALERLYSNSDFQAVILNGYFRDKAVEYVSLLANDQIKASGKRVDIIEDLVAISSLEDYFITIRNIGGAARQDLSEIEADERGSK